MTIFHSLVVMKLLYATVYQPRW